MLKTLRASSLKLGSDKPEYVSQSKRDFVNNYGPYINFIAGKTFAVEKHLSLEMKVSLLSSYQLSAIVSNLQY